MCNLLAVDGVHSPSVTSINAGKSCLFTFHPFDCFFGYQLFNTSVFSFASLVFCLVSHCRLLVTCQFLSKHFS